MKNNYNDIEFLFEKYSNMVLRIAFTYVKNIYDAEDICQKVFIKIYEKKIIFNDSKHEKLWITRVTINSCKDMLRSSWKKMFILTNNIVFPEIKNENKQSISSILKLPVKYRQVIYLYYFENYTTYEIAEILGKNNSTIRGQLKRARDKLKKILLECRN